MNPYGLDPAQVQRLRAMSGPPAAQGAVPFAGGGVSTMPPEAMPSPDEAPPPPMPQVVAPTGVAAADPSRREWIREGMQAHDFGLSAMDPMAELRRIDEDAERKRQAELYAKRQAAMDAGELMVVEDSSKSEHPFVIAEGAGGKGYFIPAYGPHEMEPMQILEDGRASESNKTDTPYIHVMDALGNQLVIPDYGPYRGQAVAIGSSDDMKEALAALRGHDDATEAVAVVAKK
jgi:hypothetical protein